MSDINLKILKKQEDKYTKSGKITQEKITEYKTADYIENESHNSTSSAVKPKTAVGVSAKKSHKWSLFNKDTEVETQKESKPEEHESPLRQEYLQTALNPVYVSSISMVTNIKDAVFKEDSLNDNAELVSAINMSETMLKSIGEYSNQLVHKNDYSKDYLTHTNIITSMLGILCKSMNTILNCFTVNQFGLDDDFVKEFENDLGRYRNASNRIGGVLNEKSKEDGEFTWGDVILAAMSEKVIDITKEKKGETGNILSKVNVIGEGENEVFFKEDVKVLNLTEAANIAVKEHVKDDDSPLLKEYMTGDFIKYVFDEICKNYVNYIKRCGEIEFMDYVRHSTTLKNKINNLTDFNSYGVKQNISILKLRGENVDVSEEGQKKLRERFTECMLKVIEYFYKAKNLHGYADVMKIKEGEELTGRNIATTKLAELMGMNELIVRNEYATIKDDKESRHGFVMSKAKGTDFSNIDSSIIDSKMSYTGEFQRQMMMLQIFDNIIGQVDRHLNNIFYQTNNENHFIGIQGIDNDMCAGIIGIETIQYTNFITCLSEDGSEYLFSCMDKELYEHMKSLSDENCTILRNNLAGTMSEEYIDAISDRFKMVMGAIENTRKKVENEKKKFLYSNGEWGTDTLDKIFDINKLSSKDDNMPISYVEMFIFARFYSRKLNILK